MWVCRKGDKKRSGGEDHAEQQFAVADHWMSSNICHGQTCYSIENWWQERIATDYLDCPGLCHGWLLSGKQEKAAAISALDFGALESGPGNQRLQLVLGKEMKALPVGKGED